jgi:hypothetical protein
MSYIKEACISIAQKVADDEAPPRKKPDDGDGGWLRPKEVGLFKHMDPEQVMREAHSTRRNSMRRCRPAGSSWQAAPRRGTPCEGCAGSSELRLAFEWLLNGGSRATLGLGKPLDEPDRGSRPR